MKYIGLMLREKCPTFFMKVHKAYDTRSDMSHTTCWMRQNMRMPDRVSPPKTPRDTIRLQPTLSNGKTNQMTGICTRRYVYVFVCMSTC